MSGIAGAYQQVDGEAVTRVMIDRLAHRGPNSNGHYCFVNDEVSAHMAHRSLSKVGGARGAQPLKKHRLALCYDGELYNYRELKAELISAGATFTTSGNAEVVIEAWRRWGPGCLKKFRGMFAFSIFDQVTGSLFLARDHFGIKPLHYMCRKDGVVFASELKALVAAFGHELELEPGALVASMLYSWVPERRCTLSGVNKVQPGTCLEFVQDGSYRIRTYFDIAEVAAAAAAAPPIDLAEVIEASVAAHISADVPVASFLSGGLDSSIITVLAKRANPDVDAYTMTFPRADRRLGGIPNDSTYAHEISRRFGIDLHEVEISPDIASLLPVLASILDEPIGDPAALSTLLMCQAASKAGAKVVLSGIGANEFFAGYNKHMGCVMAERYNAFPSLVRQSLGTMTHHLPLTAGGYSLRHARLAKRFVSIAGLSEEAAFRRSYSFYEPIELINLLSPELEPDVADALEEHLEIYCDNQLSDRVNRMCLTDARFSLPGRNLAYTDRASMATSTEVRFPFVDPLVFRAAFSLFGDQKLSGRNGKMALREAAAAWLPNQIVRRPKVSFSVPLRAWVSRDLRTTIDNDLLHGELVNTGFLRADRLRALVAEDRAGHEDGSRQIWHLLMLELWYRQACEAGVAL
jgi:asparagine synthase (glutamine-hydrolysing)